MVIIFIALVIVNWIIYHKIFNVVYFRLGAGLFKEFGMCFFLAGLEIAILKAIGKFLLPIIFIAVLVIGVGISIMKYGNVIKKGENTQEDSNTTTTNAEEAKADTITKEATEANIDNTN